MEIKSFNKAMTLFLLMMLLGVSSGERESTDCISQCLSFCTKGARFFPLVSCFYDCWKECKGSLPGRAQINYCDLDCVTDTCLDNDTDPRKARACAKDCSDICNESSERH